MSNVKNHLYKKRRNKLSASPAFFHAQEMDHMADQLVKQIQLSNDDYTVSNINLQFNQYPDKIEYVVTCNAPSGYRCLEAYFHPSPSTLYLPIHTITNTEDLC